MTVAAAFKFDGGVLFCADTKITTGVKTDESKISTHIYKNGKCATVFVFSGIVSYAHMAIRRCEEAIEKLPIAEMSMESIERVVEATLAQFYQTHIFPNPEPIPLNLLVGVWFKGETRLFSTEETTLNLVDHYECLGSGGYLMRYWIRQFLGARPNLPTEQPNVVQAPGLPSLQQAGFFAACGLKSVMEYDEYCGGEAEFLIMKDEGGELGDHVSTQIHPGDHFPFQLQESMWRMLGKLADIDNPGDADCVIKEFLEEVRKRSDEQLKWWYVFTSSLEASVSPSSAEESDAEGE